VSGRSHARLALWLSGEAKQETKRTRKSPRTATKTPRARARSGSVSCSQNVRVYLFRAPSPDQRRCGPGLALADLDSPFKPAR